MSLSQNIKIEKMIIELLEESMDVDPNYDPSDFLLAGLPGMKREAEETQSQEKEPDFEASEVSKKC